MEMDDGFESTFPPSESSLPLQHRKLKRLKTTTVPIQSPLKSISELLDVPKVDFAKLEALEALQLRGIEDSNDSSPSPSLSVDGDEEKELISSFDGSYENDHRTETKRVLNFDEVGEGNGEGNDQMGGVESEDSDLKVGKHENKRGNEDGTDEKNMKKKRIKSSAEVPKLNASSSNKKREEKERRAHLELLHAESQRLLRETRGAAFKPVPVVQKSITSVLEKIRLRKLELSKRFIQSSKSDLIGENDGSLQVMTNDPKKVTNGGIVDENVANIIEAEEACNQNIELPFCDSHLEKFKVSGEPRSNVCVPLQMDLFTDSQTKDSKDEMTGNRDGSSPAEEVMAPSFLAMELKFDSAPPDDVSSDEEDNEKENVDPHPHKISNGHFFPNGGDPVKAFIDEEAEEEDDSDNDLQRFQEDEEDEDNGDSEELDDIIATGFEEKPIDNERRNELHQMWLEEKDSAGTDDILRRLNVISKVREPSLLEEEEVEEGDDEFSSEADDDMTQAKLARMNSKKAKQMITQMFLDNDEAFFSSDEEETEKTLVKQRLLGKAQKSTLLSPAEDDNSREVFGLIKRLNIMPEKKKAVKASYISTMLLGVNSNNSSKSSFLSRVSSHSFPASCKQGSSIVKSFIFGRDDSNSRSLKSMSEDSSDAASFSKISGEIQPVKKVMLKFRSSQSQSSSQAAKVANEAASGTSLFEILKRSSLQSETRNQDNTAGLSQSVFTAFKLPRKD